LKLKNKEKPTVVLASYEAIFEPPDIPEDNIYEKVVEVPLSDLHPFNKHPFKVLDDDKMDETVDSVKQYGILVPGVVREREDGGYEIISGHRRKRACEIAELSTMPVIIRNVDDDEAAIILVDSNLQREVVLPSEKGFAYKLKLEAMKRKAGRRANNSVQVELNFEGRQSRDILGEISGDSGAQVTRYIRLTELVPELLTKVDDKLIGFSPAVELSHLKREEQQTLLEVMELIEAVPSLSQAQKLKKMSLNDGLTFELIESILSQVKKDVDRIVIKGEQLKKYFPKAFTPRQIEDVIYKLLEDWANTQNKKEN
jgi:ParB family chromosome partitioning protein